MSPPNVDVELFITVFQKAYENKTSPMGCSIQIGEQSTRPLSFRLLLDSLNIVASYIALWQ